eukprot:TRINITY_DN10741_c0_g2_i1.p1 TRINITY_DN10741_c0_g2~~TRINITY_DN10741_c0_g2_i1.p1  ORF type:complete len:360 (-),score=76.30 TRINITY_DN10741_c0_g2_i1:23-985(-)
MFAAACCRCMLPLVTGHPSRFGETKLSDDEKCEEEQCLLDNVIDSDEEQAETLDPKQIRGYLEASRAKGTGGRQLESRDARDGVSGPTQTTMQVESTRARGGVSAPLVDDYDDLFDEELDDEPENVVVDAKKPKVSRSSAGVGSFVSSSDASRRETSSVDQGFLVDMIDMSDEAIPSSSSAMPMMHAQQPTVSSTLRSRAGFGGTPSCGLDAHGMKAGGCGSGSGGCGAATELDTAWIDGADDNDAVLLSSFGGATGVSAGVASVVGQAAMTSPTVVNGVRQSGGNCGSELLATKSDGAILGKGIGGHQEPKFDFEDGDL